MAIELDATLTAPSRPRMGEAVVAFAPGSQVAGRYTIARFVGAGGAGEVYEAEDQLLGTKVALKAVRPVAPMTAIGVQRLVREIALARKVTHPNVCRIHDVGEHDGRAFPTMELLRGETLAERLRCGPLAPAECDRIAQQLVKGLAALHAANIVHRDFKSGNVMLAGDRAVVTDFGLAKSVGADAGPEMTAPGALLGTPSYMAPEQVEGREATTASDIYALGVVLFEMVTGTLPFHEATPLGTATARLTHDAPRASERCAGVARRWDDAIARCLERDPARRPARVQEVFAPVVHHHVGALASVVGAAAIIVAVARVPTASVEDPSCATAASKLAGTWDRVTRARVAARFETNAKPYVVSVWRSHAAQLDELTAQWAALWNGACVAPDRTSDPLLYGQRLSCLESSLLELRAFASALGNPAIDVEALARGSPGQFPITLPRACANEQFLRGQVPLPPVAARPAIDAAMVEFHRLRSDARLGTTGAIKLDLAATFAKLGELERRVRELGYVAGYEEIAFWHGEFLLWFDRTAEAEQLANEVIAAAEQTRDDAHLILGLVLAVTVQTSRPPPYDGAAVETALARATQAAGRLGNPAHLLEWIEEARVEHLVRSGRKGLDTRERLAGLRSELHATSFALWARGELARMRAWNGEALRAASESRALLREREQLQGPSALLLGSDYLESAMIFALAGDVTGARAAAERAITIFEPAWGGLPSTKLWGARMRAAGFAAQLGARDAAERHVRAAIADATASGTSELGAYIRALRALRRLGQRQAAELVMELAAGARGSTGERGELAGEREALAADAGHGERRAPAIDPGLRWNAPERGDVAALRGIALVDAGDAEGAIAPLEEAIWIYGSCCLANAVIAQDARLALARARWQLGDHETARGLAMLARDRLATMGPALGAKTRAADAWLGAHAQPR